MLAGMPSRNADDVISVVPPRMGAASTRQIAVNAVMSGAKPEYLPVIVAARKKNRGPCIKGMQGPRPLVQQRRALRERERVA